MSDELESRIAARRFWEKVERDPERPRGCWIWTGSASPDGYGHTSWNGKTCRAHRVAYELKVGPIPPGLALDHLCCNPPCVNPDHLEPVTDAENHRRGRLRRTHCASGHAYTPENTHVNPLGHRRCRKCWKTSDLRRRAKKLAEGHAQLAKAWDEGFAAAGEDAPANPYRWPVSGVAGNPEGSTE